MGGDLPRGVEEHAARVVKLFILELIVDAIDVGPRQDPALVPFPSQFQHWG